MTQDNAKTDGKSLSSLEDKVKEHSSRIDDKLEEIKQAVLVFMGIKNGKQRESKRSE
jgi:hypothetical protein